MATLKEVEEQALTLSESDRAFLAAELLESLPAILVDEDEGVAEATRRDAELDINPATGMTMEEFRSSFGR